MTAVRPPMLRRVLANALELALAMLLGPVGWLLVVLALMLGATLNNGLGLGLPDWAGYLSLLCLPIGGLIETHAPGH